jgi:hypothetical protein
MDADNVAQSGEFPNALKHTFAPQILAPAYTMLQSKTPIDLFGLCQAKV